MNAWGIDLRRVEEIGLNGVQTQRQLFYDGWLLRVSPGRAKRGRSVNPHFGSTLPLAEKIRYCERVYAERQLPMLFRITPFVVPGDLEAALVARGYQRFDTTLVQVLRLEHPPEAPDLDGIDFTSAPMIELVDAVAAIQGLNDEQRTALHERVVHSPLSSHGVIAKREKQVVGCGQVTLDDGVAGIYGIATYSEERGRGIGTGVTAMLLAWAWEHRAGHAFLHVNVNNERALAVYRRVGFETAYASLYLGRPGECR